MLLLVEFGKVLGNHLVGDGVVLKVALDVGFIRRHVDQTVSGEVEEDNLLLARFLALQGLADGSCDGVGALRGRNDALGAGKEHTSLEGFQLRNVDAIHVTVLDELGDDHACTMIAQTTSVDV